MGKIRVKVKEIIRERGLTQQEVAAQAGLRPSTISEIDVKTSVNLKHLAAIADALQIKDLNQLLEYVE